MVELSECILRFQDGKPVYSHQLLVIMYMRNEGCKLEDAIAMVDMTFGSLKIEHDEPDEDINFMLLMYDFTRE